MLLYAYLAMDNTSRTIENLKHDNDYLSRFQSIVDKPLDSRLLHSYAETALDDLIKLVSDITIQYRANNGAEGSLGGSDLEIAALLECGLDPSLIEQSLDHISDMASKIQCLQEAMCSKSINHVPGVIIPTDPTSAAIELGSGTGIDQKEILPKLDTLAIVVQESCGIDFMDDESVKIYRGEIDDRMMRKSGYDLIEIPELRRYVLTCDELGNKTFILDMNACASIGIGPEKLIKLTKSQIKDCIIAHPGLGIDLVFSERYADKLFGALTDTNFAERQAEKEVKLLRQNAEPAPEGFLSGRGVTDKYHIDRESLLRAVSELGESLGEINVYRFGPKTVAGYSPEQQEMIIDHLRIPLSPPEGYLPAKSLFTSWGVDRRTFLKAVGELHEHLGNLEQYRFGPNSATGYSPEQQTILKEYLGVKDLERDAPEGYSSLHGMARRYHIDRETLDKAIAEMGTGIGELLYVRSGTNIVARYSPDQQSAILDHLDIHEKAPNGYLSRKGIKEKYNYDYPGIKKAISELGEELGEVKKFRFGPLTVEGYSQEQQEMIVDHLKNSAEIPKGVLSLRGMSVTYGLHVKTLQKTITQIKDRLGDTQMYRFGFGTVPGYSIEQQKLIIEHIHTTNTRVKLGNAAIATLQNE